MPGEACTPGRDDSNVLEPRATVGSGPLPCGAQGPSRMSWFEVSVRFARWPGPAQWAGAARPYGGPSTVGRSGRTAWPKTSERGQGLSRQVHGGQQVFFSYGRIPR